MNRASSFNWTPCSFLQLNILEKAHHHGGGFCAADIPPRLQRTFGGPIDDTLTYGPAHGILLSRADLIRVGEALKTAASDILPQQNGIPI